MNAFDLYDAVFDSANDYAENTTAYVKQYADGAFDLYISDEVAQKIVDCRTEFLTETEKNGEGQNNQWHCVEKSLSEIEL